ncbi:TonB-dependent siderophore receptor [Herbaspirillum chlorophenolicum]|uniref:TonB-dependent siderophore receptor n=1 Tax=Herbaspirillum chlorophenolicum TaxID=211589 RepID=A0ABW8EXR7_9BURK
MEPAATITPGRLRRRKRCAGSLMACGLSVLAPQAIAESGEAAGQNLPHIDVLENGESDDVRGFVARKAGQTIRSDAPLVETPRSVSVLTRELMDSQQTTTVTEALRNVAGVAPGSYGRRGWDDMIIRGQRATESIMVDGLPMLTYWLAQEPFGYERIDVLKGGASAMFGNAQAGGLVNMISKRPMAHAFTDIGASYGSYDFKQVTLDMGRPLDAEGLSAWRLNALVLDRADPTNGVYQRNYWIAPSARLRLGRDTDLTLLLSLNQREYIRQQGLPPQGTILPNRNGQLPSSLFTGEPSAQPYQGSQLRLGYELEHRFGNDWKLLQSFRAQQTELTGTGVFNENLATNQRTQGRSARKQDFNVTSLQADTALLHTFEAAGRHEMRVGVDLAMSRHRVQLRNCRIGAIDLFQPRYGMPLSCTTMNQDRLVNSYASGVYVQDYYKVNDALSVQAGLRYDTVRSDQDDYMRRTQRSQTDSAWSGNLGLSYRLPYGFVPYASYSTSFSPTVDEVSVDGKPFVPDTGRQVEAGVKWASADQQITANLAFYDLVRRNVTASDPLNRGYSLQVGEQRTRGAEIETTASFGRWQWTAAYANTLGKVTQGLPSQIGKPLDNVPRQSLSLWATYRFRPEWTAGLGGRYESAKRGYSYPYTIPAYTVLDASISYASGAYRLGLNVKNLADRRYYAGGINDRALTMGDPRTVLLTAGYQF